VKFPVLLVLVLLSLPALGQVATGRYQGDGRDSRVITGVGFQPDVVLVKGAHPQSAVARTATMVGDVSLELGLSNGLVADRIQSLEADGFTVGTHSQVNASGVVYDWVAFRQVAGELKVGTYVGNGSVEHTIAGVGFQPAAVLVLSARSGPGVFRFASMPEPSSFLTTGSNALAHALRAMVQDGFVVGNCACANEASVAFHYVAWRAQPGRMGVGTYTGNGTDNRLIADVGFQPGWVWVKADGIQQPVHKPASSGSSVDTALYLDTIANGSDLLQALVAEGFQVGSDFIVNRSQVTYYWAAFAPASGLPDTFILSAPPELTASSSASFSFSSDVADATFQCRRQGVGDFAACSNPVTFEGLGEGAHLLEVRARDAAGNLDPIPARHSWHISLAGTDAGLPDAGVQEGPQPHSSPLHLAVGCDCQSGVGLLPGLLVLLLGTRASRRRR
jgi:hypothetical protein